MSFTDFESDFGNFFNTSSGGSQSNPFEIGSPSSASTVIGGAPNLSTALGPQNLTGQPIYSQGGSGGSSGVSPTSFANPTQSQASVLCGGTTCATGSGTTAGTGSPVGAAGPVTGSIADYFARAVIIILGFIFVAVGLSMFKGSPVPQIVGRR